jgi:hypothetical protein
MKDLYEGTLVDKLLFVPKEPSELLGRGEFVVARNNDTTGMNVIFLYSEEKFRKVTKRLTDHVWYNTTDDPAVTQRNLLRYAEIVRRSDKTRKIDDHSQHVGSYVQLDQTFERIGPISRSKLYILPGIERLVLVKVEDLGRYIAARAIKSIPHLANAK